MTNNNNNNQSKQQNDDNIADIKQYLVIGLINWHWFVISCFISLCTAYLVNRYTTPIYKASTTMLVKDDDGKKNKVNANDVIQTMSALNGVNIQNQIGILKSYLLNDVVLSELDFGVSYHRHGRLHTIQKYLPDQLILIIDTAHFQKYNIPLNIKILSEKEYCLTVEYMGKTLQKIDTVMSFGETYENSDFKFTVYIRNPERFNDEKPGEYDVTINSHNALVNKYKNKLSIQQTDKESTILTLTTSGFTPDEVCDYLNKLTEVYIRYGLDRKNDVIKNTIILKKQNVNIISVKLQME